MLSIRKIQKLHLKHLKDAGKCTILGNANKADSLTFTADSFQDKKQPRETA